ncbi:poly alpha-glucosyltransferase [Alkanindiges illinoisensis]|uniref:poly alpha-glucosyltransferase n=1 Tax=Alkanindiges illinoisensis TaxID=197183 RepID=UPI0006885A7D|nr:poly alpha-glucosyltransferase [Alkanindiges illinoisensis]
MSQSPDFKKLMDQIYQYFNDKQHTFLPASGCPYVLFVSYGNRSQRAQVWQTTHDNFDAAWKRCQNFLAKLYEKNQSLPEFIKVDLAYQFEKTSFEALQQLIQAQPHNNHFRRGISFDSRFELAFLEQELYGSAIIKSEKITQPGYFDQANLASYIKKKYKHQPKLVLTGIKNQPIILFDTFSLFIQNNLIIELNSKGMLNGIRAINHSDFKSHIRNLITANAEFLYQQIQPNGKFIYGYFPAYNKTLKSYNTVRHCTSLYALIESLEVQAQPNYLPKIRQAIEFAVQHLYAEVHINNQTLGYMLDGTAPQQEIKLGANAAAILMITKYYQLTQDAQYLPYAEKIAKGILSMVSSSGETIHVLHYPSLELKEKFRIVYYDGEAAFALLRLYQINQTPELLATVEQMFEHFIAKDYWKYHDHWLSYCTNELSMIKPDPRYFEFGLNNYLKNLKFIKNRQTAYATFLEMLMSAHKMVCRLKANPSKDAQQTALLQQACLPELEDTIELRANYQRIGFFYPEMAMYFGSPQTILNAFFVRHDRFRTRIDDSEHNLSGYIAYYLHFERQSQPEAAQSLMPSSLLA